tara:strand:- start:561 stop:959 length:399 start_codon:yes stop_codon:yes gene_type:complete
MNLIKFPKVTSAAVVVDTAIILDASKLVECTSTGVTCVATFAAGSANSILTFTVNGASAAAKLKNATAIQTAVTNACAQLAGPAGNSKGVFDFFPETAATPLLAKTAFEARLGLVVDATATAGIGITTIALT